MSILDEIDSGLDIDALRDVASAVNALKTEKTGVLMVTHYRVRSAWSSPACTGLRLRLRVIAAEAAARAVAVVVG